MTPSFLRLGAQGGSALIIAMLLLAILSLLAVSGMHTSASELTMAGNEQYRARAFEAAQTGIERAIAARAFNSTLPTTIDVMLDDADGYTLTIRARGSSTSPLSQGGTVNVEHFEIQSTGRSLRGSRVSSVQGFFVVPPSGEIVRTYWYRNEEP